MNHSRLAEDDERHDPGTMPRIELLIDTRHLLDNGVTVLLFATGGKYAAGYVRNDLAISIMEAIVEAELRGVGPHLAEGETPEEALRELARKAFTLKGVG